MTREFNQLSTNSRVQRAVLQYHNLSTFFQQEFVQTYELSEGHLATKLLSTVQP